MRAREDHERLIEVGLAVCLRHGCDATTLAEIAAAGVSEDELTPAFRQITGR